MEASAADCWELEGLARLDAARSAIDAALIGHWPADPGTVVGVARLVASAGERFRRAQLCRRWAP